MKLLGLFSIHFLYLMVILGFVAAVIDSRSFEENNKKKIAAKVRILGYTTIFLSFFLYTMRAIIL